MSEFLGQSGAILIEYLPDPGWVIAAEPSLMHILTGNRADEFRQAVDPYSYDFDNTGRSGWQAFSVPRTAIESAIYRYAVDPRYLMFSFSSRAPLFSEFYKTLRAFESKEYAVAFVVTQAKPGAQAGAKLSLIRVIDQRPLMQLAISAQMTDYRLAGAPPFMAVYNVALFRRVISALEIAAGGKDLPFSMTITAGELLFTECSGAATILLPLILHQTTLTEY